MTLQVGKMRQLEKLLAKRMRHADWLLVLMPKMKHSLKLTLKGAKLEEEL
jgi:hypothetical protein